jgi:hypothetical protein
MVLERSSWYVWNEAALETVNKRLCSNRRYTRMPSYEQPTEGSKEKRALT